LLFQIDQYKLVAVVSASAQDVMGERQVMKWPLAIVVVMPLPSTKNVLLRNSFAEWNYGDKRSEILLRCYLFCSLNSYFLIRPLHGFRYNRTPAVACSRTLLVYSQQRTPGVCSILDFWPGRWSKSNDKDNSVFDETD